MRNSVLSEREQGGPESARFGPGGAGPPPADLHTSTLIGCSAAIEVVRRRLVKVATTTSTVLITGESGTGKELVAREIHALSTRRHHAFVPINCGAIPDALLESQLFGHVRGAFTSAVQSNRGLFLAADHGTLFLDEVGELPLGLQVKLLRAIEDREIWPVGGSVPYVVDVRLVAATNRDLADQVARVQFREDLYYRLNVASIALPPLRDRRSDIPLLVAHFIRRLNAKLDRACAGIDEAALDVLMDCDWKGNVRELENIIERAMNVSDGALITLADLASDMVDQCRGTRTRTLRDATRDFEEQYVNAILRRVNFDKREAARLLGISLSSLYRKLERQSDDPEAAD